MAKLKPCPFCGRKMAVDYRVFCPPKGVKYGIVHEDKYYAYFDDFCYGGTDYQYDTVKEAIEAWED